MATKKIGGTAHISVNGQSYSTQGDFGVVIQNVKRVPVPTTDGEVFYLEDVQPSQIEAKLLLTENLSVDDLINLTNATIVVDLNDSHTAILSNAFTIDEVKSTGKDAVVDVKWAGIGSWME